MERILDEFKKLEKNFDSKLQNYKNEIISDVCTELKGKVMKTWHEGTERFFNDAKSSVSVEGGYSRSPSVLSDNHSRSRSVSKDFQAVTKVHTYPQLALSDDENSKNK